METIDKNILIIARDPTNVAKRILNTVKWDVSLIFNEGKEYHEHARVFPKFDRTEFHKFYDEHKNQPDKKAIVVIDDPLFTSYSEIEYAIVNGKNYNFYLIITPHQTTS